MAKSAVLGLASGLTMVVLTLIVVALVNLPQTTDAAATARPAAARCTTDVDQGYGLPRTAKRDTCSPAALD